MNDFPPIRRLFRFSLAMLFLAVAVFACWLGYYTSWIRERQEYLETVHGYALGDQPNRGLRLLGEEGIAYLVIGPFADNPDPDYARTLFPEAEIFDPSSDEFRVP